MNRIARYSWTFQQEGHCREVHSKVGGATLDHSAAFFKFIPLLADQTTPFLSFTICRIRDGLTLIKQGSWR